MAILITGGAGYIGSHMVYAALDRGDDLSCL
jgi:nucleoside-diphosphate-sugar epimerase